MKTSPIRVSLLSACIAFCCSALDAQVWDGATQANSWAHQDKDDSFTFYDEAATALRTWSRDGGLQRTAPLGTLPTAPEKWVIDTHGNPWVVSGSALYQVGPTGKLLKSYKLPGEVADVGWDVRGFVLSYRAAEPYLEKRDYKGSVIWSFGVKPSRSEGPAPVHRRPILIDDAGNILMASGASLNLMILNGATGQVLNETNLVLPDGRPAPPLDGTVQARLPMALWPGKDVILATVKSTQVPAELRGSMQGLALARIDLKQSRLAFLPTGLNESHLLVGVLDTDAVFVSPKGGLVLVKVQ